MNFAPIIEGVGRVLSNDSFQDGLDYVRDRLGKQVLAEKLKTRRVVKGLHSLRVAAQFASAFTMATPDHGALLRAYNDLYSNVTIVRINAERERLDGLNAKEAAETEKQFTNFLQNLRLGVEKLKKEIGYAEETSGPMWRALRFAISNMLVPYGNVLVANRFNGLDKFADRLSEAIGFNVDLDDVVEPEFNARNFGDFKIAYAEFMKSPGHRQFQRVLLGIYRSKAYNEMQDVLMPAGQADLAKNYSRILYYYEILDAFDASGAREVEIAAAERFFDEDPERLDVAISLLHPKSL